MAQVFISYSRADRDFVRQLHEALAKVNRDTWVDWQDIPLTAQWQQEILTNIEGAENFAFVISPEAVDSPNCLKEINHAVVNNKRIVPILYRHVSSDAIPETLGKFQRIDFSGSNDFDAKFATLIAALDTDLTWVKAHTRLLTRAKEWQRAEKDNSFLLHGKDLRDAEHWHAKSSEKDPPSTTLQSQYILASRQFATKLQKIITGAIAVALLITAGLAIYAFVQKSIAQRETAIAQQNARESKARELAAIATETITEDPEEGILLGMQALNAALRDMQPNVLAAAEKALHQALLSSPVRLTLRGHISDVFSIAFSPDGKRLATASADHTAKLWDALNGRELLTLHGHTGDVRGIAFSPDGKRLATASADHTAKLWDAFSGRELLTLSGHADVVIGVAFSPDGKRLATTGGGIAKLWDPISGQELLILRGHLGTVIGVAFSPDGKLLATTSMDRTAKVWNTVSGQELLTLRGHSAGVQDVTFNSDGKRLATASADHTARVWDAVSGHELLALRGHTDTVISVAFSPDGKRLATASADQSAKLWDVFSGDELVSFRNHQSDVMGVAFNPDGKRLVTTSRDCTARVWNAVSGDELLTLRGHTGAVYRVAFSPDGKRLATASWDHTAKVWDAPSGQELLTFRNNQSFVLGVAFSPDGKRLATSSLDETVQLYALDIRELLDLARSRVTRNLTPEECQQHFQSTTCPPLP
jgi:WD40 repeat protein